MLCLHVLIHTLCWLYKRSSKHMEPARATSDIYSFSAFPKPKKRKRRDVRYGLNSVEDLTQSWIHRRSTRTPLFAWILIARYLRFNFKLDSCVPFEAEQIYHVKETLVPLIARQTRSNIQYILAFCESQSHSCSPCTCQREGTSWGCRKPPSRGWQAVHH